MGFLGNIVNAFTGQGQADAYGKAAGAFGQQAQKYQPFIDFGTKAGTTLQDQYSTLLNDPNFIQNMIAKQFYMSPYQSQLLNTTTQRMNANAANSGMLFSPKAQKSLNEGINTQTGQFLNDFIGRGMQSYGQGLQGTQNMYGQGLQALDAQGNMASQQIGAELNQRLAPISAANNFIGMGTGLGMAYATGGASAFPGIFGAGASGAGSQMPMNFQGAGSLNPNTSSWTGQYSNPYSSTYRLG